MPMMHGHGSMWTFFLMLIFWIGLMSLGVYLIKNFMNGKTKKQAALETLKQRLAKGEINEKEYYRLKSIIEEEGQE